jgi:hypothetical protein
VGGLSLRRCAHIAPAACAGQKQGGQVLIGGLDITVSRNFFGSQIESFETLMAAPAQFPAVEGCGSRQSRRCGGAAAADTQRRRPAG